jgi:hypothetical protein
VPQPDPSAATTGARPLAARKLHFFRDGYTSALCGGYMASQVKPSEFAEGTLATEGVLTAERCPTCERKLRYFKERSRV